MNISLAMKTTVFLFLLLTISSNLLCNGNNYDIKLSDKFIMSNAVKLIEIVGHDSSGFYILQEDYSFFIEKFNNNMEFLTTSRLKIHKGLKSRKLEKLVLFHDTLYLFISEQRFRETSLFAQVLDKNTLTPVGKERQIYSTNNLKGNFPEFIFQYSLLQNKLLVISRLNLYNQKNIILDFIVLEQGLKKQWTKQEILQYNYQPPRDITYTIDEDGNLHVLSLIYEVKWLLHLFEDLKAQYLVLSYTNSGESFNKYIIDIVDKYIRGIKIIAGNKGTFICAGFYSRYYRYGIAGVFNFSVNPTNRGLKPIKTYRFDSEFLTSLSNERQARNRKSLYGYELRNLVLRDNGDVVIVGEQEYEQRYDNVNNIILVGINSFGDVKWKNFIFKTQTGDQYTSFSLVAPYDKKNVKLLYNEDARNSTEAGLEDRKSFFYRSNSYVVIKNIDEYGYIESDSLLFRKKNEPAPYPSYTYDFRDGRIIMISKYYRNYQFLKMRLFD